jgi:sodium-dependent phosphate cotransporter
VVKCLKSVLVGSITDLLKENVDKNLPSPFGWLTDYLYILSGVLLTFAVQSSSIVLSILTPIVAIGVISVERAYPITAGANLGTTITGLIAAFANASGDFSAALQVKIISGKKSK